MRVGEPGSGKSGNLKSDGCLTPRSGVRALAQGASPGIDFRDKTSREAAAPSGWDVHAHTHTQRLRAGLCSHAASRLGHLVDNHGSITKRRPEADRAKGSLFPLRYKGVGDQHVRAVIDYKRKVYGIRDLPTLPVIAQKVMKLADDDASAAKLAAIISSDQALSARVLRLANSAYYGYRARIGTIQHAMVVIGMNMLKQLSLSALVCATVGRGGKDRVQFWKHSFATAKASALIAKRAQIKEEDLCFMAGLLHDVGKMIIDMYFPA